MHPTSAFHVTDRAAMLAFTRAHGFATLVDGSLNVAQVPVLVDEGRDPADSRLFLHLARHNPIARAMPTRVVAVMTGAHGYVSPDWYARPDQVPTWNYESVEVVGTLEATSDDVLRDILARLSAEHEAKIPGKAPWTMEKLTTATLEKLVKGIVGATLSIEMLRGTQKLSQNKPADDRSGVIGGLERSASHHDHDLAARMKLHSR